MTDVRDNTLQSYAKAIWAARFDSEVPDWFVRTLRRHARRLVPACQEDFLSLVAIECLELFAADELQAKELLREPNTLDRLADRVRHRLLTAAGMAKGSHQRRTEPLAPEIISDQSPLVPALAEARELAERLQKILSARDFYILHALLEGHTQKTIAQEFGIDERTVRRIKQRIANALRSDQFFAP